MKTVKHDSRISDCKTLEDLIANEKIRQEKVLQDVIEQYNTDELDSEISQIQSRIAIAKSELSTTKEETEKEIRIIQSTFDSKSTELQNQIIENSKTIEALRQQQIDQLKQ